jgi:penicillin-binding protein 2
MARRFGLGERLDLPLSAVSEGLVPDKNWKRRTRGETWRIGDSLNAAIGQGYNLTSPLQLAVMTARLASGEAIRPRLVKSVDGREQPVLNDGPLGLSPTLMAQIRKAMFDVNNHRRGTAYRSRIVADDLKIAGKTGTSQVRSVVVRNEDVPWEQRDHALFVGYAPYHAPRVACAVVVEHGGGGSAAAAPVARDILARALHDDLPPLEIFPASQRSQLEALFSSMPLLRDDGTPPPDRA